MIAVASRVPVRLQERNIGVNHTCLLPGPRIVRENSTCHILAHRLATHVQFTRNLDNCSTMGSEMLHIGVARIALSATSLLPGLIPGATTAIAIGADQRCSCLLYGQWQGQQLWAKPSEHALERFS
jgi:hypothetical protein